jgi:hypothetical protein
MLARYAVLPIPAPASGPQVLLLSKLKVPISHAESTLLQVLILKQLKVPLESITFEKQGRGYPVMVNQLLETSHPLSSSALRPLCLSGRLALSVPIWNLSPSTVLPSFPCARLAVSLTDNLGASR